MPLNEIKSCLLTSAPIELTALIENGEVSVGAIPWNKDLGIIMTANCKWIEQ